MRQLLLLAGLLAATACTDSETGFADVTGQAFQPRKLPLANSTVAISCSSGAIRTIVPTDSAGRYHAALESSAGARVLCRFGAPGLASPLARADTLIGFAPAGVPHALQLVDLLPIAATLEVRSEK